MGWKRDFKRFNFYEFMEKSSKRRRRRKKTDPASEAVEMLFNLMFCILLFILFILRFRKKKSILSDPVNRIGNGGSDRNAADYKDVRCFFPFLSSRLMPVLSNEKAFL